MSNVVFAITPEKKNTTSRLARGAMVATQGPQSTLYTGATKVLVDDVATRTSALKALVDDYSSAKAAFLKARTAMGTGVIAWDASFDLLVATGENVCATADEGAGLGLPAVAGKTKYPFAMPASVDLKQDPKTSAVRIHVRRAPGMKATCVEISTDPTNPMLWKELDGSGAIHVVPNPPPGMLYVRAATRGSAGKSAFTTPVSILIK
jgi:hypothetical protein